MEKEVVIVVNDDDNNNNKIRDNIYIDYGRDIDMKEVIKLHEECFPLAYDDKFYNSIFVDKKYGGCDILSVIAYSDKFKNNVIGAAVLQLKGRARDKIDHWEFILNEEITKNENSSSSYLMTLAVTEKYRRYGVASKLISFCIGYIEKDPFSFALYLHTPDDNIGAQKFYEKYGFLKVGQIKDFYYINQRYQDGYIYSFYIHGGYPPAKKEERSYLLYAFYSLLSLITSIPAKISAIGQGTDNSQSQSSNMNSIDV